MEAAPVVKAFEAVEDGSVGLGLGLGSIAFDQAIEVRSQPDTRDV
jgi:hypothetical protein